MYGVDGTHQAMAVLQGFWDSGWVTCHQAHALCSGMWPFPAQEVPLFPRSFYLSHPHGHILRHSLTVSEHLGPTLREGMRVILVVCIPSAGQGFLPSVLPIPLSTHTQ